MDQLAALMDDAPAKKESKQKPIAQKLEMEESKEPVKQAPIEQKQPTVTNTKPKPSFETLISYQLSEGKWNKECGAILQDFFTDSNI